MTALTTDRNTNRHNGGEYYYPMVAAEKVWKGSIGVLDASGNLESGTTATGKICVGMISKQTDNSAGAAAAIKGPVKTGVFDWENSATDAVTKTSIGDTVYIEDDQTVSKTATGKSAAGTMVDLDTNGRVWVKMDPPLVSGLAAANNLSDVGTVATARTNLGLGTMATQAASAVAITGGTVTGITDVAIADGGTGASTAVLARVGLGAHKTPLVMRIANIVAADTKVYRLVSPIAGTIAEVYSVLQEGALAVGDATITLSIGGVAVTDGVVTIAQAGSAAGDVDNVTPSAAHVLAVGDVIEATVGGTNTDTDAYAELTLDVEMDQ